MNATNWFSTSLKTVQEIYSKAVSEGASPEEAAALAAKSFQEMAVEAGLPATLVQQWVEMIQAQGLEGDVEELLAELSVEGASTESVASSSLGSALLSQSLLALEEDAEQLSKSEEISEESAKEEAASLISKPRSTAEIIDSISEGSSGLTEDITASSESDTLSYEGEVGDEGVIVDLNRGLAADAQGGVDNISGFANVKGSAGDDYIVGDDQDNELEGMAGADTLIGGAGNDYLIIDSTDSVVGGEGTDTVDMSSETLSGSESFGDAEVLVAGAGNDVIDNDAGSFDAIHAGAGDDEILGSQVISEVDGGEGFDVVDLYGLTGTSTLDLNSLQFNSVEELVVESGDLTVTGSLENGSVFTGSGDDMILAGSADDTIGAGGGNDIISGGSGNDQLQGESGDDSLSGGEGADVLFGDEGDDTLEGGAGDDTLFGDTGLNDSVLGGADYLVGGEGNDNLQGEAGDDTLVGNGGDVLVGGAGNDSISAFDETDEISGGEGVDTLSYSSEDGVNVDLSDVSDVEVLYGTSGDDDLSGLANFSMVSGGAGNDVIEYADGVTVDGGEGYDILDGSAASSAMTGSEPFTNIESIIGSEFSDSIVAADVDYISGGLGDDYFALSDVDGIVLDGGEGSDLLDGSDDTAGFSIDLSDGDILGMESIIGGSGSDTLSAFQLEGLTGTSGADTLMASGADAYIVGGGGNDSLVGGSGDDTLDAGEKDDYLSMVNATLTGGDGEDVVLFEFSTTTVTNQIQTGTSFQQTQVYVGTTLVPMQTSTPSSSFFTTSVPSPVYETTTIAVPLYDTTTQTVLNPMESGAARITDFVVGEDILLLDDLNGVVDEDNASEFDFAVADDGEDVTVTIGDLVITLEGIGDGEITSIESLLSEGIASFGLGDDALDGVVLSGGLGNDVITGGDHGDTLYGGEGDDEFHNLEAANLIDGGEGNDAFYYTENNDLSSDKTDALHGGEGDDTVFLSGGVYDFSDGSGVETISLDHEGVNVDVITTSEEGQYLIFGGGKDVLQGGDGDDTFSGSIDDLNGMERINGGDGDDYLLLDLTSETDSFYINTTLYGFENIVFSGDAYSLDGEFSASEHKLIDASVLTGNVEIDLDGNNSTGVKIIGGSGNDRLSAYEYSDSDGQDTLIGGAGDDALLGHDGADFLSGGSGNDYLNGGDGGDYLSFDDGIGQYLGGNGYDTIDLSDVTETDLLVNLDSSTIYIESLSEDSFDHNIRDIEAIRFSDEDDVVEAYNTDDDRDVNISLHGGLGDDLFLVEGGNVDGLHFIGKDGLSQFGDGRDNLFLGGDEDNFLVGGDGNDLIIGGAGDDTIDAGDFAKGTGRGEYAGRHDVLTGGEGNDVFRFDMEVETYSHTKDGDPLQSIDIIDEGEIRVTDFELGEDILLFNDLEGNLVESGFDSKNFDVSSNGDDLILQVGNYSNLELTLEGLGNSGIENISDMLDLGMIQIDHAGYNQSGETVYVSGGEGNDLLVGGDGADVIDGSGIGYGATDGDDTLTGGDGDDIFNLDIVQYSGSHDSYRNDILLDNGTILITDFTIGEDVLQFNNVYAITGPLDTIKEYLDITVVDDGEDVWLGLSSSRDSRNYYDGETPEGSNGEFLTSDSQLQIQLQGIGDGSLDDWDALVAAGILQAKEDLPEEFLENDVVSITGGTDSSEDLYVENIARVVTDDEDYYFRLYGDVQEVTFGAGNDTLWAYQNSDGGDYLGASIDGGLGDDSVRTYRSWDTLIGGEGDDTLRGHGDGDDVIFGGLGDDSLRGSGDGDDYLSGGEGDDTIRSESDGNDILLGGAGNDSLIGESDGNDILDGGVGDDYIRTSNLEATIIGGEGTDTLEYDLNDNTEILGSDFADFEYLVGGYGNDTFSDVEGLDGLEGGYGNDSFVIDPTSDLPDLDGGRGDDVLDMSSDTLGIEFDILTTPIINIETILGGSGDDTMSVASDSLLGSDSNETIEGSSDDEWLVGAAGSDSIFGGAGDDTIDGGYAGFYYNTGSDTLTGGAGNDVFNFDIQATISTYYNGSTLVTNSSLQTTDRGSKFLTDFVVGEDVVLLSDNYDNRDVDNENIGEFSSSYISMSNDGTDVTISVYYNLSIVLQGLGTDNTLTDIDSLVAAGILDVGPSIDSLDGWEGYELDGGAGDDHLTANSYGSDTLIGGAGNDTFAGVEEGDSVDGGVGDDAIYLSEGMASLTGGEGMDSLFAQTALAYDLSVNGVEEIYLDQGGDFNDTVSMGGSTDDIMLIAGGGNDSLVLGSGDDTISINSDDFSSDDFLSGGSGNDELHFDVVGGSHTLDSSEMNGFEELMVSGTGTDMGVTLDGSSVDLLDASTFDGDLAVRAVDLSSMDLLVGGVGDDTFAIDGVGDTVDGGAGADLFDFTSTSSGGVELSALLDFGTDSAADKLNVDMFWDATHAYTETGVVYEFTSANLTEYGSISILNFGTEDSLYFGNTSSEGVSNLGLLESGMEAHLGLTVTDSTETGDVTIQLVEGGKSLSIVLVDIGTGSLDSLTALDSAGYGIDFDIQVGQVQS